MKEKLTTCFWAIAAPVLAIWFVAMCIVDLWRTGTAGERDEE